MDRTIEVVSPFAVFEGETKMKCSCGKTLFFGGYIEPLVNDRGWMRFRCLNFSLVSELRNFRNIHGVVLSEGWELLDYGYEE